MVTKDPIEIWRIEKTKRGEIKNLYDREGNLITKEHAVKNIKDGQVYLISSEDGDNSAIGLYNEDSPNPSLRTVKDDTDLNNLEGNTNLKIDIIEE